MSVVSNVEIMGLESSIIASGYPMRTELTEEINDGAVRRCCKLAKAGGAEEQFLTGIVVNFDLTFTNKAWVEIERYRFMNFVSSQSTMHRIAKFDLPTQYNEYVDERIVAVMKEKVCSYESETEPEQKKRKYLELLYSNPCGFTLTARMTTNYRCLKNIYYQRRNHRLPEWREFCRWIETLPYAKEFIMTKENA